MDRPTAHDTLYRSIAPSSRVHLNAQFCSAVKPPARLAPQKALRRNDFPREVVAGSKCLFPRYMANFRSRHSLRKLLAVVDTAVTEMRTFQDYIGVISTPAYVSALAQIADKGSHRRGRHRDRNTTLEVAMPDTQECQMIDNQAERQGLKNPPLTFPSWWVRHFPATYNGRRHPLGMVEQMFVAAPSRPLDQGSWTASSSTAKLSQTFSTSSPKSSISTDPAWENYGEVNDLKTPQETRISSASSICSIGKMFTKISTQRGAVPSAPSPEKVKAPSAETVPTIALVGLRTGLRPQASEVKHGVTPPGACM